MVDEPSSDSGTRQEAGNGNGIGVVVVPPPPTVNVTDTTTSSETKTLEGEAGGGNEGPQGAISPRSRQHSPLQPPSFDGEYDSEESQELSTIREAPKPPPGGYWRAGSRPTSPGLGLMIDNASESSLMGPQIGGSTSSRPKSRMLQNDTSAKYHNLSYWRARKLLFFKNGDPFFPGLEFRFKPGRDVTSLDTILDKLSLRMDLPRGARYVFNMDGTRMTRLEELEDGGMYVVSSYKTFKNASYGKKNGVWYSGQSAPIHSNSTTWSKPALSRKQSMVDGELPPPGGGGKSSPGRVIRIVNNLDHTIQCRVVLNLRTTQPFEEVLEDLGQVLKMSGAKRMFTVAGQEVRSFSQLRNEFADVDTFYLSSGLYRGPSPRRSRSRTSISEEGHHRDNREVTSRSLSRGRSKSSTRIVYDADLIRTNDYTLVESLKEDPARVTIRGLRRTFYPPLHHAPQDNTPPDKRLSLAWVFGYRGTDTRKNLWVLPSGELLYYVAAIAVLYDRDEDSQRHYIGHTEDIQCMELHPSREMVASGQKAGRHRKTQAHIRIWSTETLLTLYVFGMGEFEVGVSAVSFSQLNGGSYVLAVDAGRERILSVWQWQWGHLLGKVATLQDELTGAVFHPLDDNLLITHGKGNLTFWIRRKDGFFERTDIIKPPSRTHVTSIQFEQDGDVVTADSDGFITIYSVDADGAYFVRLEFEAHNKGIGSVVMLSEGTLLSGGEKDRKIIAWDSLQNYKKITETKLPEVSGGVRSLYPQRPGRNDGNIYVGTTRNCILEGSLQRRFNQVLFGHGRQLWGLAAHPDDEVFATAGHDRHVALWRRTKLVWATSIPHECISLAFHPFGAVLAAGSSEGHLVILNAETGSPVTTVRVCGSPLTALSYNPGDVKALLAEKSPASMKDVKWYTQTCTVGYLVAGIWNNRYYPMTSLIVSLNRSSAHDLLVTGDADGYLRLFRYPCVNAKAEYVEDKVYSQQVAACRFLFHDKNVVTVGGSDAALMLWDVVDE